MQKFLFVIFCFLLVITSNKVNAQYTNCYYYYTSWAYLELLRGNYTESIKAYNQAFSIEPNARPYDFLSSAKASAMLRDTSTSIFYLEQAIKKGISWEKINQQTKYFEELAKTEAWKLLEKNYPTFRATYMLHFDMELRIELAEMQAVDQYVRRYICDYSKEQVCLEEYYVDSLNLIRMLKIIEEKGFPTFKNVGFEGVWNANTVLGHAAFRNDSIQVVYLNILKSRIEKGNTHPSEYTEKIDRYRVINDKPQLYGEVNKFYYNNRVKSTFNPIEDIANVDKRRADLGLLPLKYFLEKRKLLNERFQMPEMPEGYVLLENPLEYMGCE